MLKYHDTKYCWSLDGPPDARGDSYTSEESLHSVTVTKLLFSVLDSSWGPVWETGREGEEAPVIKRAHCPASKSFITSHCNSSLGPVGLPTPPPAPTGWGRTLRTIPPPRYGHVLGQPHRALVAKLPPGPHLLAFSTAPGGGQPLREENKINKPGRD